MRRHQTVRSAIYAGIAARTRSQPFAFLAGDTGYYTARGELYVLDRIKDLVKCMDQQVAPAELEELLQEHAEVVQAAVAGVPHPEYGEAPRAFVVLKATPATADGRREMELALIAYIKSKLSDQERRTTINHVTNLN